MVAPVVPDQIEALVQLLAGGDVVVLSGAGISTDSGIPDYRGDGRGMRRTPITYSEFVADPGARRRYWARSHAGWSKIAGAEPNPCHYLVADWQTEGWVGGVITQNVDGLHTAAGSKVAGSKGVLELHGSLAETVCLSCGDRRSRLELHHRLEAANPHLLPATAEAAPDGDAELADDLVVEGFVAVDCLCCGGVLKPDVVFFGENVPRWRVEEALRWVETASCLLVLGSSLTVMSGYRLVMAARRGAIPVAIVSRGPTRGDEDAAIKIDAPLGPTLARVDRRLSELAASGR